MGHHLRTLIGVAALLVAVPLALGACMSSPRDGQIVPDKTVDFNGYVANPGERILLLAEAPSVPGLRVPVGEAISQTTPTYDGHNVAWYRFHAEDLVIPEEAWQPWYAHERARLWAVPFDGGRALYTFNDVTAEICWEAQDYVGMDIIYHCTRPVPEVWVYTGTGYWW